MLRPRTSEGTVGLATWCAVCGGLAAAPAGFDPLILARWMAAWLIAVPLMKIAWSGVGWTEGERLPPRRALSDDGPTPRSAAHPNRQEGSESSWTLRLVASAMAVAVAFLLGDGALPWTAVLLLVVIASNQRRGRADGPPSRRPSGGRPFLTRVLGETLGPFILSWLALGGASSVPLDVRIAANLPTEVLGWIRLNADVLTVGALLSASLTWAHLRAIDPKRSDGGRSVPAALLPMAAVVLTLSGHPIGASAVALVTGVGWPVLHGAGTGVRRLARPTVWLVGLALFLASLGLGWDSSSAVAAPDPETARPLRPATPLGYTAVGAAPRGVNHAATAPNAEPSVARCVPTAG